ncbi:unnamed protein product [Meloidogyne enterolobii]|uniref:Uncharacterized protein n=1 Tax=Meloidogyne enterolobii TaxID=390850 RepID=A0ACB1A0V6_MELEN
MRTKKRLELRSDSKTAILLAALIIYRIMVKICNRKLQLYFLTFLFSISRRLAHQTTRYSYVDEFHDFRRSYVTLVKNFSLD